MSKTCSVKAKVKTTPPLNKDKVRHLFLGICGISFSGFRLGMLIGCIGVSPSPFKACFLARLDAVERCL